MSDLEVTPHEQFLFEIKKKNPKPNAVTYELKTIEDIFEAVSHDNVDSFLREFEILIRMSLLSRSIIEEQIKEGKLPADAKLQLKGMTWTDD